MQAPRVTLLSYGSGNVRSAMRALERVGAQVTLTSDPHEVTEADGLVVPGVGAFGAVMEQLRAVDAPRLIEQRLAGGRPVLGICVGMQVMFERSDEHGTAEEGLGQWPGTVSHLRADVVPHMGWSLVRPPSGSVLFDGIATPMRPPRTPPSCSAPVPPACRRSRGQLTATTSSPPSRTAP